MTSSRRRFLKRAGGSALAGLMLGLPRGWAGGAYADDSPETTTMRFGMIALTDCSPIVMAHELGYFKQFGIESVVSKEASWAVIRDKLSIGDNQATHMLIGMPLASGGIHPDRDINLITIPPAQMVANMKVDKMDGFCVGEPWNNRAIADGIGFRGTTTQKMWKDHPERVDAFTEGLAP